MVRCPSCGCARWQQVDFLRLCATSGLTAARAAPLRTLAWSCIHFALLGFAAALVLAFTLAYIVTEKTALGLLLTAGTWIVFVVCCRLPPAQRTGADVTSQARAWYTSTRICLNCGKFFRVPPPALEDQGSDGVRLRA